MNTYELICTQMYINQQLHTHLKVQEWTKTSRLCKCKNEQNYLWPNFVNKCYKLKMWKN